MNISKKKENLIVIKNCVDQVRRTWMTYITSLKSQINKERATNEVKVFEGLKLNL